MQYICFLGTRGPFPTRRVTSLCGHDFRRRDASVVVESSFIEKEALLYSSDAIFAIENDCRDAKVDGHGTHREHGAGAWIARAGL